MASLVAVIAISLTIAFLWIKAKSPHSTAPGTGTVKFESRKITDGLPNSVVFDYNASAFRGDSVFIQQSWDPERRELVAGAGKQHTSIYYYPGYFMAKLIVNGDIKKEAAVFIKTKGWKGIIDKKPVPVYLHQKEMEQPGAMGISTATLQQKTGSPVFNDTWVSFYNVREFGGLTGSDFTLETTLRNTAAVEASLCRKVKIYILAKGGAIIIPLSDKGCIADLNFFTGERLIRGKEYDLSAFGCDFNNFQQVKCTVANRHLAIYLNNKVIFSEEQKNPIDEIIGLCFDFEGTGEIRSVKLAGPGKVVYEESF
jgi:hypothetical protein